MNNGYVQFSRIVKDDMNGCQVMVPGCVNTDYCASSPVPVNDGILAMAFVDMQPINGVYPEATAFCNGTLFPNLNMPFLGGKIK